MITFLAIQITVQSAELTNFQFIKLMVALCIRFCIILQEPSLCVVPGWDKKNARHAFPLEKSATLRSVEYDFGNIRSLRQDYHILPNLVWILKDRFFIDCDFLWTLGVSSWESISNIFINFEFLNIILKVEVPHVLRIRDHLLKIIVLWIIHKK